MAVPEESIACSTNSALTRLDGSFTPCPRGDSPPGRPTEQHAESGRQLRQRPPRGFAHARKGAVRERAQRSQVCRVAGSPGEDARVAHEPVVAGAREGGAVEPAPV